MKTWVLVKKNVNHPSTLMPTIKGVTTVPVNVPNAPKILTMVTPRALSVLKTIQ